MRRAMCVAWVVSALFLFGSLTALADPAGSGKNSTDQSSAGEDHYRKRAHKHRPAHVVVRPARAPVVVHRTVVVRSGPVVHEAVEVVPVEEQKVVEQQYVLPPREDRMLGLGLRLSGIALDGQTLNLSTMENPAMGGFGLQIRSKVSRNVGLEFSGDWLVGQQDEVTQTTMPLMLTFMYYVLPTGGLRLHGDFGAGLHFTKMEYDRGFRYDMVQLAGQVGGGLEVRLSTDFALTADLRVLGVYQDLGERTTIYNECMQSKGGEVGFCNGVNESDPFNMGAQFMVGANIYF